MNIFNKCLLAVHNTNLFSKLLPAQVTEKWNTIKEDWLNQSVLSLMNYYPPYLGAGIRIDDYDPNFRYIRVKMDLNWWNQNYVGTHFGGSLYSMCDPFYMLMLINNIGSDYKVWDKSASVRFQSPGRGTVHAEFELSNEDVTKIRQKVAKQDVCEPVFKVDVIDEQGQTIAEIEKELHVTKRKAE